MTEKICTGFLTYTVSFYVQIFLFGVREWE